MALYRGPGGAGDATNDATSQSILAAASAAQAAASATAASASASQAATSATNAASSATAASNSATAAASSANSASTSATNAANSATAAQTAQTASELAETNAETAEANAETAEANATASAALAQDWATKTSGPVAGGEYSSKYNAQLAATSATNASNSASSASTSATNASNSASAAATSATNAAASAIDAQSSEDAAAAYASSINPANFLAKANNLSDLSNTSTARANLGLGTAATMMGPASTIVGTTDTQTLTNKTLTSPIINGTGVTFNDESSQASAQVGMKNRLIDAGFIIKQRGYVSGTALAAGAYAHDRWKAGSGGCTYTFTQGSLGVPITITITAGSLLQIIEGCNMPEGGTYTVSWTGTAQARVNGGSYSSSPLVVTGLTAGANCTVEFNTGTLSKPSVEVGSTATSFDYRPYGTELALCQRYYYKVSGYALGVAGFTDITYRTTVQFPVTMRSAPTLDSGSSFVIGGGSAGTPSLASFTGATATQDAVSIRNSSANWTTGWSVSLTAGFNSEL